MTGHPRESGEQSSRNVPNFGIAGSSPRERGTAHRQASVPASGRVIPARAGNSDHWWRDAYRGAGHPRESGEQSCASPDWHRNRGSSPRERGTEVSPPCGPDRSRVIPARAGNSSVYGTAISDSAGHPRESGEQIRPRRVGLPTIGSSPRERGTGSDPQGRTPDDRVIPARAGNSARSALIFSWSIGSSPRERGTDPVPQSPDLAGRVIPARAGNRTFTSSRRCAAAGHPRESGEQDCLQNAATKSLGSSPRERGTAPSAVRPR